MKCDELKVYVPQDGPYGLEPEEGGEPVEEETCYLKSDVDKVIADLEESHKMEVEQLLMKIAGLKEKLNNSRNARKYWRKEYLIEYKESIHHKYKRCLAMANWCCDACDKWMMRKAKAIALGKDGVKEYYQAKRKLFLFMRWQTRWLKIAEQFKEGI